MNIQPSAHRFQVADNLSGLQAILPFCSDWRQTPQGKTITIMLQTDRQVTVQEIGRLLIVNGKFRMQEMQCRLRCPAVVYRQLCELDIDRLIWLDCE